MKNQDNSLQWEDISNCQPRVGDTIVVKHNCGWIHTLEIISEDNILWLKTKTAKFISLPE